MASENIISSILNPMVCYHVEQYQHHQNFFIFVINLSFYSMCSLICTFDRVSFFSFQMICAWFLKQELKSTRKAMICSISSQILLTAWLFWVTNLISIYFRSYFETKNARKTSKSAQCSIAYHFRISDRPEERSIPLCRASSALSFPICPFSGKFQKFDFCSMKT